MFHIDFRESLLMLPAILLGFSIHEFAHACTAKRFGDSTAEKEGRISLNPLVHIDFIGLLLFFFGGFGWAKPVPVNPLNFKNRKRDDLLVSLAGPFANFLTLAAFAIIVKLIYIFYPSLFDMPVYGNVVYDILTYFIWVNITMTIFNLLPIPPLDGSHILFDLLPDKCQAYQETFFKIGGILLIILVITDILPIGRVTKIIYDGICGWLEI
jgi:Zn-dependent proteases